MTTAHSTLSHPKYRPDIDGLRAIAVLFVIAFHAFPRWVGGGFIGVDIFFVISGYLISSIVFENLNNESFSFTTFYSRRIRRIFPALILVLTASFLFGWFSLLTNEYKQLGKHIAGGAGFISNFILWNESGYFDNLAETKPLLHLWSLGIEEQFYLLWPVLLWISWKRKYNFLWVTLLITLTSFIFNIKGIYENKIATFYSPQTRFWELLSGGLLAWYMLDKYKKKLPDAPSSLSLLLSWIGLLLLFYGFFSINSKSAFPGIWAVCPVLGTFLIIYSGPKAWVNRIVLSHPLAIGFGLISYPLYLWHWPILSFIRIIEGNTPSRNMRITAVLLAMVFAWITYQWIEKPIRQGKKNRTKVTLLILLMVCIGYAGYNNYSRNGFSFRSIVKNTLNSGQDGGSKNTMISGCGIQDKKLSNQLTCTHDARGNVKYALIGDSKAAALYQGLIRTSNHHARWLFIGGGTGPGGLPPLPVITSNKLYQSYQPAIIGAVKAINQNPNIEKVVLVFATRALFQLNNDYNIEDLPTNPNFQIAFKGLNLAVEKFIQAGKKIVLVVDNPTLPHPEDCIKRKTRFHFFNRFVKENPKCILSLKKHLQLSQKYHQLLELIETRHPNEVKIFDTLPYLCDIKAGICTHNKSGRRLYGYSDHISNFAAGLIGKDLNKFLESY